MALFEQSHYDEQFNVTRWLPTFTELVEYYNERKGKASKTRFINELLSGTYDTMADLIKALERRPDGMLHGARHTYRDLKKLENHIQDILKLKNL
jgi:exopolyphosphatase/pppGpp-phosphohydrolase